MAVIADIFEVILIDTNGDTIGTTSLQEGSIETQVQESDVRAGRGNSLRGVLHSDRDITISLTDVGFKYDWLAKQLGQDIVTGAGVAYSMPKFYDVVDIDTVTTGNQPGVTLDKTPKSITTLVIFNESGVEITGFTLTTNKVDFTSATPAVAVGDRVEARTYTYDTAAETQTIEINNSVFAKGVKAILETIEIDESTETATHTLQWQFDNALPTGNFTINTSSAKEANTQEFSLRVVKPKTSDVVGRSLRIPV
jgi:hypothetical protein